LPDLKAIKTGNTLSRPSLLKRPVIQALLAGFLALVLYLNNLQGAFLFDDWTYIVENPLIRDFSYFKHLVNLQEYIVQQGVLLSDIDLVYNFVLRPVTYLTYAINYRLHGTDSTGYNLLNNLFHVAATMLVYLFTHLLVRQLRLSAGNRVQSSRIPFLVALLFACHPIQAQAVSYTIQRFTSIAACCYLLSLSAYILSRQSLSRHGTVFWYALAMAAAVTGMLSKENVFTLPIMITVLDFICFRDTLLKRLSLLLPFLAAMAIIPLNIMGLSGHAADLNSNLQLVNFEKTPHLTYLFTEFRVLVTYLRLLVLPVNQQLDYDYPLYDSFFAPAVIVSLLFLLTLASVAAYSLYSGWKNVRSWLLLLGFGILWFFVTLSVESGLVPMDDVIFEHRLYLPSVGIFIAITAAGAHFFHSCNINPRRHLFGVTLALAVITIFSIATVRRNSLWADTIRFMEDNAAKSPQKERVQILLGDTYLREGKPQEAIAVYEKIRLTQATPQHVYTNLANAYIRTGDMQKGVQMYQRAIEHAPSDYIPYSMLGMIHVIRGDLETAREMLDSAISRNRFDLVSRKARAEVLMQQNKIAEAMSECRDILKISPDNADALRMLNKLHNEKR